MNTSTKTSLISFEDPSTQNKSSILSHKILQKSNTKPYVLKECRICLQNQLQPDDEEMIQACQCSGSVQYIHQKCLKQWIMTTLKQKTQLEIKKIQQQGIECQLCKHPIKFIISYKYQCKNCQNIKQDFIKGNVFSFFLSLLLILSMSGLILSLWCMLSYINSFQLVFYLSLVGLVISTIFQFMAIYLFISAILIENIRFIKSFIGIKRNQNSHFSRHKVFPILQTNNRTQQTINQH